MSDFVKKQLEEIWQKTLTLIADSGFFDPSVFHTWIKDSELYDIDDDFATIVVPYQINKTVIKDSLTFIQQKLSAVLEREIAAQVFSRDEIDRISLSSLAKTRNAIVFENKIKPEYTFENFIIGKSNREAQAAALSCCYYPGKFNNPLFIYGNSGLGKTHLLHAIGNYIRTNQPQAQVLYIYSEDFVTLLIESMKNKTVEEVKEKIAAVDYLLIDDIQRLTQSASQEIFFNLYNKLISDHKQIVITSDIHPNELRGIENRLISRFSSGLSVTIAAPEFETAKAILSKKIEGREDEVMIDDAVLDFLALKFSSDVRKLEGTLNELFFKAILYNPERIDLTFAKEIFREDPIMQRESSELSVKQIKKCVCDYYGLTKHQIESKSRTKNISTARQIAMYLCRKHLELPYVKIGLEFGGRDHSTALSSCEKMSKLLKENEVLHQAFLQIERKLGIG
ncbi:MAG: chromosomal replication initiator protein DnaA [Erysipelotrichaceae bacterium]|nr:chromosomal replication initiator protein DnaA [Erysipelotrichaceae bacterium]MCI9312126.1 chromosomal replication initiator protein DnaA [Erysipelotrichaceae bacterium]